MIQGANTVTTTPTVELVIIRGHNKSTQRLEDYVFQDKIPVDFNLASKIQNDWDWYHMFRDTELRAKAYTAKEANAIRCIRSQAHARKEEHITLQAQQILTCPTTGIQWRCELPCPMELDIQMLHPFAMYENVDKALTAYYKKGIKPESCLDDQVLAGMLLTVLRHQQVLVCKDVLLANQFLAHATSETLSYAVRYFYSCRSMQYAPQLSLHLADTRDLWIGAGKGIHSQAETLLLNYIRACRGESVTDSPQHTTARTRKTTVKVYTDKVVGQYKGASKDRVSASALVDTLAKSPANSAVPRAYWNSLRMDIKMLVYLTPVAKAKAIASIHATLAASEESVALAKLFETSNTDAIQDDLLSVTHSIQVAGSEKKEPVDLMALLAAKIAGKDKE